MKAILVIDIDDRLVEDEDDRFSFAIDGYLMQESDCVGCYEAVGLIRNAVLKPMPKESIKMPNDEEYMKHYKQGRNDVIAEIKGEMMQTFSD